MFLHIFSASKKLQFDFFRKSICFCCWNTLIFFLHWLSLQFVRFFFYVNGFLLWQQLFYFERIDCALLEIATGWWSQTRHCCLNSCHIFSVVSMAILMILRLILSAVSTFVFSNRAKILDRTLTNCFLSMSPAKSLSNSSCTESDRSFRKSKTLSIASLLLFSLDRKVSNSLFISSKSRVQLL